MKVTLLGSGTCVPRLARSASSVLVETKNLKMLLDIGPGTIRRLTEYGSSILDLTHIFLTHFHPDHTAELVPLLFATKYPNKDLRTRPLVLMAGPGLKRFYSALRVAYGDWIVLENNQLTLIEIKPGSQNPRTFEGVRITTAPVNHRPESLACRIDDPDGFSMVYSGDTDECETIVNLARFSDLFICDASFPDELKAPGHSTPGSAGRMAAQAQAKRLVLNHLYPPCDDVDIVKQAAKPYKGPIIVAEDLMSFVLD